MASARPNSSRYSTFPCADRCRTEQSLYNRSLSSSAVFAKDDSGWAPAVLLAAVFFALMYALRHRAFPRWLTHLGVISYSLYLLHPVLLQAALPVVAPAVLPRFFVVLIVLSHLTYRLVEAPAQRYGRRWTRPKAAAEICGRERSVVGSATELRTSPASLASLNADVGIGFT